MQNRVGQVTTGLFWTYAERITAQIITMAVTIILARIIAPEEYGIISIVLIFINIANSFVVNGFGNSLIQKKEADDLDFSTVFYFSIGFSFLLYLVLFIGAPLIADFYSMPQLTLVIRIMMIRLPIAAVNSIQQAYISRRMEFRKFFFATLGGTIVSAFVGIIMAYNGFGIWSVVAQYLTNVFIDTIVLSFTSGWRPRLMYSSERMKGLFSFGWKIMAVGVMTTVYANLRNLLIGKKYTSSDLAYCEKGEQFPSAIAGNINTSISKVLFPVLSTVQDNIPELRGMVRRSIKIGSFVLFPLMFGFASVADSFVLTFLTEKWAGCIPFLRMMCVIYALQPLQTSALQSFKAVGKSGLYLWIDIIKKVIGLIILFISLFAFDNVYYVVLGALVIEILSVIVLMPFNKKVLSYSFKMQIIDILPSAFLTAVMCIVLFLLNRIIGSNNVVRLFVDVPAGMIVYVGLSIITKNENYYYILRNIKERLVK